MLHGRIAGSLCHKKALSRLYATFPKAFSKTLLLPKTSFPLWTDPNVSEKPFRARTSEELYRWQSKHVERPSFVFHDGPPYANGDLHMGHALNKILKDIINRFHLLRGHRVSYVPGWDCHGLPIENKALQTLGEDARALASSMIRTAANDTAIQQIAAQKEQFRTFGIMADWDSSKNTYRTLDHSYEMRQLQIFQKMVERGLIYRRYRPVHYSPSSRSALAEAELVYKENHVSHSVYVTFDLDGGLPSFQHQSVQLLVWTTTPWTLTANMGIAVNPELDYVVVKREDVSLLVVAKARLEALEEIIGQVEVLGELSGTQLAGLKYKPIFLGSQPNQASLPIISSSHVTPDSGTGLVHCAPAHGAEDHHVFQSLSLLSNDMVCHVDAEGAFDATVKDVVGEEAAGTLVGKAVLAEGSKTVVDLLTQLGSLVKVKRITHKYPYDWKTDKPIIVTATSQWFANLDGIAHESLSALKNVQFYPPHTRNRLEAFISSRSEWCISRQRVWGVPIPSLHHMPTDTAVLSSQTLTHILSIISEKGVKHWWDGPVEDFLPASLLEETHSKPEEWRKGTDTMDVWFDSGTSWSMLDGKADVCLEGSDQHRGWFQSQILTSVAVGEGAPYKALITHGMVLDEKGKKMSKSQGNIVSPLTIVFGGKDKKKEPAYGADMLRLWAATVEYWKDMSIGPTILSQTAESMRRIRNTARFILGNVGGPEDRAAIQPVQRSELGLAERYVMHELYNLEQVALSGYSAYNFPKVISALVNFNNITMSSLYFDITKDCLYADDIQSLSRRRVVTVLDKVLDTMTNIAGPVLPHLAEEIHQNYRGATASFFQRKWEPLSSEWDDPIAAREMEQLLHIRKKVLALLETARGEKQVRSSLEAEVDIIVSGDSESSGLVLQLLEREQFLKTLFIVSDCRVIDEGSLGTSSPSWLHTDVVELQDPEDRIAIRVRPATQHKCPRCWTFTRPEEEEVCPRCKDVLKL